MVAIRRRERVQEGGPRVENTPSEPSGVTPEHVFERGGRPLLKDFALGGATDRGPFSGALSEDILKAVQLNRKTEISDDFLNSFVGLESVLLTISMKLERGNPEAARASLAKLIDRIEHAPTYSDYVAQTIVPRIAERTGKESPLAPKDFVTPRNRQRIEQLDRLIGGLKDAIADAPDGKRIDLDGLLERILDGYRLVAGERAAGPARDRFAKFRAQHQAQLETLRAA